MVRIWCFRMACSFGEDRDRIRRCHTCRKQAIVAQSAPISEPSWPGRHRLTVPSEPRPDEPATSRRPFLTCFHVILFTILQIVLMHTSFLAASERTSSPRAAAARISRTRGSSSFARGWRVSRAAWGAAGHASLVRFGAPPKFPRSVLPGSSRISGTSRISGSSRISGPKVVRCDA